MNAATRGRGPQGSLVVCLVLAAAGSARAQDGRVAPAATAASARVTGKLWSVEAPLDRGRVAALHATAELAARVARRAFGKGAGNQVDAMRLVPGSAEGSGDSVLVPFDPADPEEALHDRVALAAARRAVERHLGPAAKRAPAWVPAGLARFCATLAADPGKGEAVYARRADAWRRDLLALPEDAAATRRLLALPAGAELSRADELRAWGLAFYAFAPAESRSSAAARKIVAYVKKVAASGDRPAPALDGLDAERALDLERCIRDFVDVGDVPIPAVRVEGDWCHLVFERVQVSTDCGPRLARQLGGFFARLLPEYQRFYEKELGLTPRNVSRATVRVFRSKAAYDEWTKKRTGKVLRAHYVPWQRELELTCEDGRLASIESTLLHEFAHRWNDVYFGDAPTWLEEGLATFLGGTRRDLSGFTYGDVHRSVAIAQCELRRGTLDSLPALVSLSHDAFYESRREVAHYHESCALVAFVLQSDARRRFCAGASNAKADARALEAAFGTDVATVERSFRAWLGTAH